MSVLMVGGNKCMERRYLEICEKYGCKAKVYNVMRGELKRKIGSPDLIIVFVKSVSHKMAQCARHEAKKNNVPIEHCNDSINALNDVLKSYCISEQGIGENVKILIYGAGVVGTFPLEKGGGNEVL